MPRDLLPPTANAPSSSRCLTSRHNSRLLYFFHSSFSSSHFIFSTSTVTPGLLRESHQHGVHIAAHRSLCYIPTLTRCRTNKRKIEDVDEASYITGRNDGSKKANHDAAVEKSATSSEQVTLLGLPGGECITHQHAQRMLTPNPQNFATGSTNSSCSMSATAPATTPSPTRNAPPTTAQSANPAYPLSSPGQHT
jgi:hypothetical protein